jgi:plasmid stabilization system protein ParE
MVQRLIITKTAGRSLEAILMYLEENFSISTAQKLAQKVDNKVQLLFKQPFIGRPSSKAKAKTIRKIGISKHLMMYYRVVGTSLVISDFFDSRQNPDKSRF